MTRLRRNARARQCAAIRTFMKDAAYQNTMAVNHDEAEKSRSHE